MISDLLRIPGHNEPSFIAETSFVRAPLNSRVGQAPVLPKSKGKAREENLDGIPVDIQEAIILEDLLFILMVHQPLGGEAGDSDVRRLGHRRELYNLSSRVLT
jgi:hypothetical protein